MYKWDAATAKKESEATALGLIASRPRWRKDYENALRRSGVDAPEPAVISLLDEGEPVVDGFSARLDGPDVLGARITGVRFTNHLGPSGATHRDLMLLTDGEVELGVIDAEVNGVRLILLWNGSRPKVQYIAGSLTPEEAAEIQAVSGYKEGDELRDSAASKDGRQYVPPTRGELIQQAVESGMAVRERKIERAMEEWTGPFGRAGRPRRRFLRKHLGMPVSREEHRRIWAAVLARRDDDEVSPNAAISEVALDHVEPSSDEGTQP